ncbi:MAG: H-type lectin domain-containing protein [Acidobacteria bacterium]|nr:H-type lectin domain-containing protein [Acidobacteriota bacterium]
MRCILFVILIAFASNALAQEKCERIIELSQTVKETAYSKKSFEQHVKNFCSEYHQSEQSGKTMDVGLVYKKVLAGNFGSSSVTAKDIASNYCSQEGSVSDLDEAYKQYVTAIAPGAYEAYAKCKDFEKRGVTINLQSLDANILQVTVNFTKSISKDSYAEVRYSDKLPSGITCNWDESKSNVQRVDVGTRMLTCTRTNPMMKASIVIFRRDAVDSVLTLHWPAYNAEGDPVDSLKALRDKVSALESRTISQSGEITMRAVNTPGLEECGHGSVKRGELEGKVKFPVAFSTAPTVSAGLTQLLIGTADVRDRHSVRFEVTEVDKEWFKYKFWTEGDNKVSIAKISWIAVVK